MHRQMRRRKSPSTLVRGSSQSIDAKLQPHETPERALHEGLLRVRTPVLDDLAARAYQSAFERLAALRPVVDAFFDQVLVNDPDQALRDNRFALLQELAALFGGIADLSCLPG